MIQASKMRLSDTRWPGASWSFWLLALFFLVPPAYSQSLGGIARQERERRREHPSQVTHVYDNDDLARPQILVPTDRARFDGTDESAAPAPDVNPVQALRDTPIPTTVTVVCQAPSVAHKRRTMVAENQVSSKNLPLKVRLAKPHTVSVTESVSNTTQPMVPVRVAATPAPSQIVPTNEENVPVISGRGLGTAAITHIRVQPKDTLWKLAAKYLGSSKNWRSLAANNPQLKNPRRLQVGMELLLPQEAPISKTPKTVIVRSGDALWKLTQVYLGSRKDLNCLARANPALQKGSIIFAGQMLTIPESCMPPLSASIGRLAVSSGPLSTSSAELLRQSRRLAD
jgi:LysM repeat protein